MLQSRMWGIREGVMLGRQDIRGGVMWGGWYNVVLGWTLSMMKHSVK